MTLRPLIIGLCLAVPLSAADAAVIGHNVPAQAITIQRIEALPAQERSAWEAYFKKSETQRHADKAALAAERKGLVDIPPPPAEHGHDNSMPLDKDTAWYATPEARHVADEIVSFQTPAGGWGKNQDRTGPLRQRGQAYVPNNISQFLAEGDFDTPREPKWNYVGTFDNNATTTELHFLALVSKAVPGPEGEPYRQSFVKGIHYLLNAQFPNGGWPQVWPLEGGYHDAITYNDNAVTEATEVMTAVAADKNGEYDFVPADLRQAAAQSAHKALACILATQVKAGGTLTIWGQQHDALTLEPVSARNFEPPVLASDESAALLVYLMSLPNPSPPLVAAVHAGITFLKKAEITNITLTPKTDPDGRRAVVQAGSKPLWARFYIAASALPVFGDRDKTLHDNMNELTKERRNGYNFYVTSPAKALKAYQSWSKEYPAK